VVFPFDRSGPRQLIEGEERDFIVRRMRITREFIRKVGFTIGCPGCRAVDRGQSAVSHNEECRHRIETMLRAEGNGKILRSDERIRERNEERDNKRRRRAGDNQENIARGGVVVQDGDNSAAHQQEQQRNQVAHDGDNSAAQQQQQQQGHQRDEPMVGSISLGDQVIHMSDWDLREGAAMKESMEVVRNRSNNRVDGNCNHQIQESI